MKCLLQRVQSAHIEIDDVTVGRIGNGLLVFVCAEPHDTEETAQQAVNKILKLRIFSDDNGKMNRSLTQTQGGLLIVSQFTLAADARKGNRPSFTRAAPPEQGKQLYESFLKYARIQHPVVACGEFGADMKVHLINDGPVTIPLEF